MKAFYQCNNYIFTFLHLQALALELAYEGRRLVYVSLEDMDSGYLVPCPVIMQLLETGGGQRMVIEVELVDKHGGRRVQFGQHVYGHDTYAPNL